MSLDLACIGLGRMGLPIARVLATRGFAVRAWNRTPPADPGLPPGTLAPTLADAARGAPLALTMLADDAAVRAVTFGAGGLLDLLPPGAIHVGMSTISRALTLELAGAHAERGQRYVAAPVFGRPDAAGAGRLWIVAGGDEEALARCAPVFAALGQGVFPFATPAEAALVKLLGNFLIGTTIEALGEALAAGEKGGVAPQALLDVLTRTLFGSPVVARYGDLIARQAFEPAGFALALGMKDIRLALEAGRDVGAALPIAELLEARLLQALGRGRGHLDWAGLATVSRDEAGLPAGGPA